MGSELKHAAMAGSLLADISRLGPENEFTDGVITAGDHRREANSVILAARSPVFRNMLASRMLEGQLLDGKRHVHLQDIPKAVLDHILHWCYTDSVSNLDMSESMDLLMAADRFELSGLVLRCSQRLSKMLSAAELPEVLELAKRFSCTALWGLLGASDCQGRSGRCRCLGGHARKAEAEGAGGATAPSRTSGRRPA